VKTAAFVATVALAVGILGGCGETIYVVQEDAASGQHDAGTGGNDAPAPCGPEVYPCPPYGTVAGTIFENMTLGGWADDDGDGSLANDPYRTWGFDMFYQMGLRGEAKYLYLNVSAGWCTVCEAENQVLPGLSREFKPRGVVFAEILFEDLAHAPATHEFVHQWIDAFDLPFPVGVDPTFKMGRYFDKAATPANIVIALTTVTTGSGETFQPMQLVTVNTGGIDPSGEDVRALFDLLLGE
jgi:hypothetical protein